MQAFWASSLLSGNRRQFKVVGALCLHGRPLKWRASATGANASPTHSFKAGSQTVARAERVAAVAHEVKDIEEASSSGRRGKLWSATSGIRATAAKSGPQQRNRHLTPGTVGRLRGSTMSAFGHKSKVLPNTSLNRTRNGLSPGPRGRVLHHRPHGPGAKPPRAG